MNEYAQRGCNSCTLEAQGVRRKVVADMFGLALRSYQTKVQRLLVTSAGQRSLWREVYSRLEQGASTRRELQRVFPKDDPRSLASVLNDLVDSGLAYSSGRGAQAVYGLLPERERERLLAEDDIDSLASVVWVHLATRGTMTSAALHLTLGRDLDAVERAAERLKADGRVLREGEYWLPQSFEVPVGAEDGWEAALCDHFGAVTTAIGAKIEQASANDADIIGGTTLKFSVHETHPYRTEVMGLLRRVRNELDPLWRRVSEFNKHHPLPPESDQVTFYIGQNVASGTQETERPESGDEPRLPNQL